MASDSFHGLNDYYAKKIITNWLLPKPNRVTKPIFQMLHVMWRGKLIEQKYC